MMAAPTPCAARAAISSGSVGAIAAQDRGAREHEDSAQQQAPAAGDVAEPPGADDQCRDGEEIREHDPLDFLEGGAERLRQRRQPDVGNAGAERRQQHGQRKAGERPPNGRHPSCACGNCLDCALQRLASTWTPLRGAPRERGHGKG